ncbi:MAG: 4-phosphopantetheinyl transferase, partial [Nitrosopumilaceae archaeon]|nr:4-phosphopantetheinyl transferase [Nitrosopumilaceae archaeon]
MIMIGHIGIGIDICDVEKFKEIPFKAKLGFYKELFNDSEIKYCLKYKNY